mgnify:FL=1|jgi:hypothetical protein
MDDAPLSHTEAKHLRLLRILVTVLTVTMILGFLTIVVLFVIRLGPGAAPLALPDAITLSEGVRATAFTQGTHWYAVVTDGDEILIFDRADNSLRKRIALISE